MEDRYFTDYRTQRVVKNLDTTFMAPELYNELVVEDCLAGTFVYTYEDAQGDRLMFSFTRESIPDIGFYAALNRHCESYNFERTNIVRKIMYVSAEELKKQLEEQGE
jgi:hypothetical protein